MEQQQLMVALLGGGALAAALGRQLRAAGIEVHADPAAVGAGLVLVAETSALDAAAAGAAAGATVVDFTPGDPADAVALARLLAERGVAFVDAPLHCEHLGRFPAEAAFLCGGAQPVLAPLTAVLGRLGAPVVVCGDTGAGRVARAIVGALAICNRIMTLEGAAMGVRNGLTVGDIGSVIERCSGSNSGTARVLPAIATGATGATTSDTPLAEAAADLALCVRLARRAYAPVLIATQACNQVLAASHTAGAGATLDDLRGLVEGGSGFSFTP